MPRIRKSKTRKPKNVSHRTPPKPVHWNCKRGTCRYCGEPIIENGVQNTRKHWHQPCADIWVVMNNPGKARDHVLKRDSYTCQDCGLQNRYGYFEVDHKRPLYEANGDLNYWHPNNLVLLCDDCHKKKTKQDMELFRAFAKLKSD